MVMPGSKAIHLSPDKGLGEAVKVTIEVIQRPQECMFGNQHISGIAHHVNDAAVFLSKRFVSANQASVVEQNPPAQFMVFDSVQVTINRVEGRILAGQDFEKNESPPSAS